MVRAKQAILKVKERGSVQKPENSILLMDPFENILTIYRMVLEEEGFQVDIETDFLNSFRIFLEKLYPIVIMEFLNSFEDTVQFIKEVKAAVPETYIIINTSKVLDDRTYIRLFDCGLDDYLLKPYAPERLLIHIRKGLKFRELILENKGKRQPSFFEPMAHKAQQEIVSQPFFMKELRREIKKSHRHQNPMSLLLLKIPSQEIMGERYESFYGTLVKILKKSLREEDIVGRENGKLGIILSQTDHSGSQVLGQRLSEEIQSCPSFKSDTFLKAILQDLSFQYYTFPGQSEMPEFLRSLLEESIFKPSSQ